MNTIKIKGAEIIFRDDLILQINYDNVNMGIEESKYIFSVTNENSPWQKSPVFLTGGDFSSQDAESKKFYASNIVIQHCSAIAFLSDTLAKRITANFFMRVFKPKVPTRAFGDEVSAITWLKNFETVAKQ